MGNNHPLQAYASNDDVKFFVTTKAGTITFYTPSGFGDDGTDFVLWRDAPSTSIGGTSLGSINVDQGVSNAVNQAVLANTAYFIVGPDAYGPDETGSVLLITTGNDTLVPTLR